MATKDNKDSKDSKDSDSEHSPEEARLRTILDSMVEAVFVTDDKGRVTLTNRALDDIISRDVRGRRGKNVIKSKELRIAIRRARKKHEATDVELETEIGDRMHTFHAQVSPLPGEAGVVTVLHDVTTLKDSDRLRRDFVANASHELRTPLTAIRGFAETLIDGAAEDPVARERFLDAIFRHTIRLQRLAEDLTALSQVESPQHDWESTAIDIGIVCRESTSSLESFARKKGITIELEVPEAPVIATLSGRGLDHVLLNLIENAIKYSPEGSRVRVVVAQDDEQVSIEVIDQGAGIPQKHQQRIFERFYRVDKGRSRDEGGTGLGLSIAKNLAQRMGGAIDLTSEIGEGSTFRVTLPIQAIDADAQ